MTTTIINIHEAKTHLSRIVEEVAAGKEVIIAKAGKPMARLVPMQEKATKKRLGLLKGKIKISADFNKPLPEAVIRLFERD
jgi:prevent-host-death family protein